MVIVASVSCIYGLGSPEVYYGMVLLWRRAARAPRDAMLRKLVEIQYQRNDLDLHRGTFRARGDVVEIFPAYDDFAVRVELFGDEVEAIVQFDPLTGEKRAAVAPGADLPRQPLRHAPGPPGARLRRHRGGAGGAPATNFTPRNKLLEAQRLRQRTLFDLEMMREIGTCKGIENYSRHLSGRGPGEAPPTLMDYLPKDALVIIDESHQTVPADPRHVPWRPLAQERRWSSTASDCPRPWTTAR